MNGERMSAPRTCTNIIITKRPTSRLRTDRISRARCIQMNRRLRICPPPARAYLRSHPPPFGGRKVKSRSLLSSPGKGEVDSPERSGGGSGGGRNSRRPECTSLQQKRPPSFEGGRCFGRDPHPNR